ncbi:Sulfotransferase domain [Dillenia turbinata]|uniref:Sulfotransferase n=1 Tax=Dillenia turbinata TaxID=194707 RepID=A0AAN8ZA60_9MAGN
MDNTESLQIQASRKEKQDPENQDTEKFIESLPKVKAWQNMNRNMYFYQGFWIPQWYLGPVLSFREHFQACDTDIILGTYPKSGTTWLKALVYAVINRKSFNLDKNPLNSASPHTLVPFFELNLYLQSKTPDFSSFSPPRCLATHVPYQALAESIRTTSCRIVYLCRNPFDTFVSLWKFNTIPTSNPKDGEPIGLEEAFDMFCHGSSPFGPFWDHFLGFWKESLRNPNKVLFLKYEDMKRDIKGDMKRLAEFLGCPFSEEEEKEGIIEEISRFCSFDNLRDLQPNKSGKLMKYYPANSFFRKGEVGDWVNYLTPSMEDRLNKVMEEKLEDSGLTFKASLQEAEPASC